MSPSRPPCPPCRLLQRQLEEAIALGEEASAARRSLESRAAELEAALVAAQGRLASSRGSTGGEADAVLVRSLREQLREAEGQAAAARSLREQAT